MKSKLIRIALWCAWGFFMFVVPIGLIVTEFALANNTHYRLTLTGMFVLGLLFFVYKGYLIARLVNQNTPLANFVRTMDAILPLFLFAVITMAFGDWLNHIGGVVGMIWLSLTIGAVLGWVRSRGRKNES